MTDFFTVSRETLVDVFLNVDSPTPQIHALAVPLESIMGDDDDGLNHAIDEIRTWGYADVGGGAAPSYMVMVAPAPLMREVCALAAQHPPHTLA